MTQPNAINSSRSTDTPNQPLLLLNDVQRRRRIKQNKHKSLQEQTKSKSQPRTKSYYIKNNELLTNINKNKNNNNSNTNTNTNQPKPQRISQQNMEENLARLYADTHITKQKSKSQLVSQNHTLLKPHNTKYRNHSKSAPRESSDPKYRKKRTFKLAEPNDSNDDAPKWNTNHSNTSTVSNGSNSSNNSNSNSNSGKRKLKKKASRNFMTEINSQNNNNEEIPMTGPSLYLSKSQNINNNNTSKLQKKRNKRSSFKLGSLSLTAASSFSSYQNKFNVHKPKMKPGSNQFLVSVQMRKLQEKLKSEQENDDEKILNDIFENGNTILADVNSIKLPNYSGKIPLILIELKKKLHSCDGLKQRKIFHISVKNNIAPHHKIATLIRNFFLNLPIDNRLLDKIFMDILIYVQRLTNFKQINGIIELIPDPEKSILLWLWDLLSDTIEYSIINKMNIESLSKSMAPPMCTNHKYRFPLTLFFEFGIQWRLYLREQK